MRIAVLSDGAWGTALAIHLITKDHEVRLWGPFPDYIETMQTTRRNARFLKEAVLPDSLQLSASMESVVHNVELIILASPTQYLRGTLECLARIEGYRDKAILNVAKGFDPQSVKRISQLCQDEFGIHRYAVLSGPSHAEEVARSIPTAVVVASSQPYDASWLQQALMNDVFRVYTSDDVIGVELGAALKNVYAIAAGIIDGSMQVGDNSKAALLTRSIAEMVHFGQIYGGKAETFLGLSGLGDLIVTCTSSHGRNRFVGEELGRGNSLSTIIERMGLMVSEGVHTTKSAYQLARQKNLEMPILDEVYAVLYMDKAPRQAIHDLMTREAKAESG